MSAERWQRAFERFVDALNHARDAARLGAAVTDDVRLERHGPGAPFAGRVAGEREASPIVEAFAGVAEVARWLARTPPAVVFSLAGPPWPDVDDAYGIQYAIDAGEFHNGGIWLARLADDGRIAFLSHQPFALRDEPPAGTAR